MCNLRFSLHCWMKTMTGSSKHFNFSSWPGCFHELKSIIFSSLQLAIEVAQTRYFGPRSSFLISQTCLCCGMTKFWLTRQKFLEICEIWSVCQTTLWHRVSRLKICTILLLWDLKPWRFNWKWNSHIKWWHLKFTVCCVTCFLDQIFDVSDLRRANTATIAEQNLTEQNWTMIALWPLSKILQSKIDHWLPLHFSPENWEFLSISNQFHNLFLHLLLDVSSTTGQNERFIPNAISNFAVDITNQCTVPVNIAHPVDASLLHNRGVLHPGVAVPDICSVHFNRSNQTWGVSPTRWTQKRAQQSTLVAQLSSILLCWHSRCEAIWSKQKTCKTWQIALSRHSVFCKLHFAWIVQRLGLKSASVAQCSVLWDQKFTTNKQTECHKFVFFATHHGCRTPRHQWWTHTLDNVLLSCWLGFAATAHLWTFKTDSNPIPQQVGVTIFNLLDWIPLGNQSSGSNAQHDDFIAGKIGPWMPCLQLSDECCQFHSHTSIDQETWVQNFLAFSLVSVKCCFHWTTSELSRWTSGLDAGCSTHVGFQSQSELNAFISTCLWNAKKWITQFLFNAVSEWLSHCQCHQCTFQFKSSQLLKCTFTQPLRISPRIAAFHSVEQSCHGLSLEMFVLAWNTILSSHSCQIWWNIEQKNADGNDQKHSVVCQKFSLSFSNVWINKKSFLCTQLLENIQFELQNDFSFLCQWCCAPQALHNAMKIISEEAHNLGSVFAKFPQLSAWSMEWCVQRMLMFSQLLWCKLLTIAQGPPHTTQPLKSSPRLLNHQHCLCCLDTTFCFLKGTLIWFEWLVGQALSWRSCVLKKGNHHFLFCARISIGEMNAWQTLEMSSGIGFSDCTLKMSHSKHFGRSFSCDCFLFPLSCMCVVQNNFSSRFICLSFWKCTAQQHLLLCAISLCEMLVHWFWAVETITWLSTGTAFASNNAPLKLCKNELLLTHKKLNPLWFVWKHILQILIAVWRIHCAFTWWWTMFLKTQCTLNGNFFFIHLEWKWLLMMTSISCEMLGTSNLQFLKMLTALLNFWESQVLCSNAISSTIESLCTRVTVQKPLCMIALHSKSAWDASVHTEIKPTWSVRGVWHSCV